MGTGTYRTVICAVSHETRGITSTRFYLILFFIFTNQKYCRKSKTEPAGLSFSEKHAEGLRDV
jgi:hypothetical protein